MCKVVVVSVLFNLLILGFATTTTINTNNHDAYNPIPGSFRIINGTPTFIEEIPWQVAHVLRGTVVCSGAIIQIDKVLTSAHCFHGLSPSDIYSSYYRSGSVYWYTGGWVHNIRAYVIHEDFVIENNPFSFRLANDLALAKVLQPFIISPRVRIVPLSRMLPGEFSTARISGWGLTDPHRDFSISPVLRSANLTVFYRTKCKLYTAVDIGSLEDDYFCLLDIREGGVGGCMGDSGGPVTVDYVLQGLVAATLKASLRRARPPLCGGIYVTLIQSIAAHVPWIQRMMLLLSYQ